MLKINQNTPELLFVGEIELYHRGVQLDRHFFAEIPI